MRLLYLGDLDGTSGHRISALRRLGHEVDALDPRACFGQGRWAERWIWHAGSIGMEPVVRRWVLARLAHERYDLCLVNHGELVGPRLVRALRARSRAVLHVNLDNPFVARDGRRWRLMRQAVPCYDAFATPRASTAATARAAGCRHVIQFEQAADEVVHAPRPWRQADADLFGSDVSFIGTWMPERGALIARLLAAGVAVKVFGPNWTSAPDYRAIAPAVAISEPLDDTRYPLAIQHAGIALGFLSEGNADQHTTRAAEVPALGTLFCAKRTGDHLSMYRDGVEAVFWDDMDECAAHCLALSRDRDRRDRIAAAGAERQRRSGRWNERLLARLVSETLEAAAGTPVAAAAS